MRCASRSAVPSPERRQVQIGRLLLSALILIGAGCAQGPPPSADSTTLERIREAGVARVGFANEAPYAYLDPETGELTGEAPEIARIVLGKLGVEEVEGVMTEFGSLIPGLKAKRFDIIAAGMYVTPERCKEVAFSNPTYSIGEAFVVQAGNPKDLHSYADVRDHADAKIGVVAGTVERGYAHDKGIPDDCVVIFPDPPSAIAGVKTGRVDAYGGTSLTVQRLIEQANDPAIERATPFEDLVIDGEETRGYGAFAVRLEDTALLNALNAELAAFIGSDEHLRLVAPFGFTEREMPGDATATQLCEAR